MTTFVVDYQPIFMVVSFGFLGFAFYLTYRPRPTTANGGEAGRAPAARMMALNKIMLWAVTVMVVGFLFFPLAITSLFTPEDEITADMTRTVIQIEGMT